MWSGLPPWPPAIGPPGVPDALPDAAHEAKGPTMMMIRGPLYLSFPSWRRSLAPSGSLTLSTTGPSTSTATDGT